MLSAQTRKNLKLGSVSLLCASLLYAPLSLNAAPQVSLFPQAVVSELQETSRAARSMEDSIAPIVNRMTNQKEAYDQAQCDGDQSSSPGCAEIFNNIASSYIQMLDQVGSSLPEMKASVNNSERMLQKRLSKELGRKKTAAQIQKDLQGATRSATRASKHTKRKGRVSLASSMERLFNRVSRSGAGNQSLMTTASLTYLDMRETSEWIERLEVEITQAKIIAQLQQNAGQFTPEMDESIGAVVSLVMGEEEGGIDEIIDDPVDDAPELLDDTFTM